MILAVKGSAMVLRGRGARRVVVASSILIAGVGCAVLQQATVPPTQPSLPSCYQPNGTTALLLGRFQAIVSGADSISARERGFHALPQGPAGSVSVVTSETTCARLLGAYRAMAPFPPGEVKQVYAFEIGRVYVVVDTKTLVGEWSLALTFDPEIRHVLARVFQ